MKKSLRFGLALTSLALALIVSRPANACKAWHMELFQDPGGVYCGKQTCTLSSYTIGFETGTVTCYYDCGPVIWNYCFWA